MRSDRKGITSTARASSPASRPGPSKRLKLNRQAFFFQPGKKKIPQIVLGPVEDIQALRRGILQLFQFGVEITAGIFFCHLTTLSCR